MKTVGDLVRARKQAVRGVRNDASVADAARQFLEHEISSVLVYDGDRVAGIFTKNDLIRRLVAKPDGILEQPVAEGMTTDLFVTSPEADLREVLDQMIKRSCRHVPVLEGGKAIGMLNPNDTLFARLDTLDFEHEQLMHYVYGDFAA